MLIYLIRNTVNGKAYVGQTTTSLASRWTAHKYRAFKERYDFPIYNAIRKYGLEKFEVSVLATAHTLSELNALEEYHIKAQGTLSPRGYNVYMGGNNYQRSEETCRKISESKKGKPFWPLGKKRSAENRENIRRALTGRKLSKEHRENIGRGGKGRIVSQETREKMRALYKGKPGHIPSAETRQKMSESHKKRGTRPPIIFGRPKSEQERKNLSNALKGHAVSAETRRKISETLKRKSNVA